MHSPTALHIDLHLNDRSARMQETWILSIILSIDYGIWCALVNFKPHEFAGFVILSLMGFIHWLHNHFWLNITWMQTKWLCIFRLIWSVVHAPPWELNLLSFPSRNPIGHHSTHLEVCMFVYVCLWCMTHWYISLCSLTAVCRSSNVRPCHLR